MPKYLNNVHGYDTQMSGFLSTLPTLLRWICIVLQVPLVAWFGIPSLNFLYLEIYGEIPISRLFQRILYSFEHFSRFIINRLWNSDSDKQQMVIVEKWKNSIAKNFQYYISICSCVISRKQFHF